MNNLLKGGLVLLTAGLVAAPTFAVPTAEAPSLAANEVIHLGTLDYATGEITSSASRGAGAVLWEATTPSGLFRNQATPTQEVLDEGDLEGDPWVGGFQIGFVADASGCVTLRYAFYLNNNFDTVGAPLTRYDGGDAVYDVEVCDLVGGGFFAYTLNVALSSDQQFMVTGPDIDMVPGTDWGWGFSVVDPGNTVAGIGPLIVIPGPEAPGAADVFDIFDPPAWDPMAAYGGSFFFGGQPPAQFHMRLDRGPGPPLVAVPTVGEVGLLALIVLLAGFGATLIARRS